MLELLANFINQICQTLEIFTRMTNTILRFTTAFLIFRNACRLFQINTQIFWSCLDDARDHALFNNGVTAWPQTSAEKQIGNITSTATHTIEEIIGLAIARDLTFDRNFCIAGVLPASRAATVVKQQFNSCSANRFTGRRTIKNDVCHRFAT